MVITDEMLYQNAPKARDLWLKTLPNKDEIPEYVCSEHFEMQMSSLLEEQKNKPAKRCSSKKTKHVYHNKLSHFVAIFMAVLLIGAAIVVSSPTARAAVFNWAREVFAGHEIYHFDGANNPSSAVSDYKPTWMPEGFALMDSFSDANRCGAFYLNEKTGDSISYECILMENTSASITVQDYYETEFVTINGIKGRYYSEDENAVDKTVVWVDETANVAFSVHASLDKDTILRIARSISTGKN